jgi:hypothetical protein
VRRRSPRLASERRSVEHVPPSPRVRP